MFLSEADEKLGTEFIDRGYIIRDVCDETAYENVNKTIHKYLNNAHNVKIAELEKWLNQTHKFIDPSALNAFRLSVIQALNSEEGFRANYFKLGKAYLETIVGNELAMQKRVNLSIQLPKDESSLLPVHADTWSGDSPFEVVLWVPLVNCFRTKSMFILPPKKANDLNKNFSQFSGKTSEQLFQQIEKDLEWIEIKSGQILLFNQTLPHGNRVNCENETRWSMNCRFKALFTPYSDKKIGEFFEPITTRAASIIGMNYRLP